MRFENFITLTAGFVLFGVVSGDLCTQNKELRKSRKIQSNNSSVQQEIAQSHNTDVAEELRNCDEGYAEKFCDENEFVCEPVCTAGCKNGKCTAPGKCVCADGYELRVNECVPLQLDICRESCVCWRHKHLDRCLDLCGLMVTDCLETAASVCNVSDKSIVYQKNGTMPIIYTCEIVERSSPNFSRTDGTAKESLWIIIGSSIFIGIMLIAIVYLCVRIYQTRHETGAHDIPISLLMKF